MRLIRLLWNVKIASTFSFKFGLMFVDFFTKLLSIHLLQLMASYYNSKDMLLKKHVCNAESLWLCVMCLNCQLM